MTVVLVAVAVLVLVALVVLVVKRRPRQDAGIAGFRRHIDALSPEARREVMDRAQRRDHRKTGD